MSNDTTENETSHAKIDMLHGSIWNQNHPLNGWFEKAL